MAGNLNTFDPRTFGKKLFAWYSARWVNGFRGAQPAAAATVAQWNDLSDNARHLVQATEANKPLFRPQGIASGDFHPALEFVDATDVLNLVLAGAKARPITVLAVWVNKQADDALLKKAVTFNAGRVGVGLDWTTNNEFGAIDDNAIQTGGGDVAGDTTLLHVHGFVARPSGSSIGNIDGLNTFPAGIAGTNTDSNVTVGAFPMFISEIQIYEDAMSLSVLDAYLKSLAHQWGIQFRYRLQK